MKREVWDILQTPTHLAICSNLKPKEIEARANRLYPEKKRKWKIVKVKRAALYPTPCPTHKGSLVYVLASTKEK